MSDATTVRLPPGIDRTQTIKDPEYFDDVELSENGKGWTVRGDNLITQISRFRAGDTVLRTSLQREGAMIVPHDIPLEVASGTDRVRVDRAGLTVLPPGDVEVVAGASGNAIVLVRGDEPDWSGVALNDAEHEKPGPRVRPAEEWPTAVGGCSIRHYAVADFPCDPNRFGTILRTRSFMVNFLPPRTGPRAIDDLSPHYHEDFEQYSIVLEGEFVHHVRTPWVKDANRWREDDHVHVGAPSVAVIPPPTVHTSAAVGAGVNRLVDVFCPPRFDFSAREGWVLNANDYPLP